jgi:hypothetical protein
MALTPLNLYSAIFVMNQKRGYPFLFDFEVIHAKNLEMKQVQPTRKYS